MSIIRVPWNVQPQVPVGIDWNNPITQGLLSCFLPVGSGFYDAAKVIPNLISGSAASPSVGIKGRNLDFNATGYLQVADSTNPTYNLSGELTLLALVSPDNASNGAYGQYPLGSGNTGASASQGALRIKSKVGAAFGSYIVDGATTLVSGGTYLCGFRRSGSSGAWGGDILLDGKSDGNISTATTLSAQQVFSIGSFGASLSLGLPFDGKIYAALVWKRAISLNEFKNFYDNPWQICQPLTRRIFVDMGAGGGLSINATAGTASADGFSASVDRQLAIAASLGLASADGHQASINLQRDIAATLGTATASGYSATINRQRDIAASLGTATAQGYGASISFGNDLNIAASLGLASADGYQANVNLQCDITASLGAAVAQGYSASISDTDPLHGFTQDQLDFLVAYMEANMAIPTAAEIATAIVTTAIDGTTTLAESLRLSNAVLGGKVSGAGTGTETFRNPADTVDRVVATVDSSGNRTAITLDLD